MHPRKKTASTKRSRVSKLDAKLTDVPLTRFWQPVPEDPATPQAPFPTGPLIPWTGPGDLRASPDEIQNIAETINRTLWRLESIKSHGELEHTRKAASRALADIAHSFMSTWPPKRHVQKRWQALYDKDPDFGSRWVELGEKGRRTSNKLRATGQRVFTTDAKIKGFIRALNWYVSEKLCGLGYPRELLEALNRHDLSEHARVTKEFMNRHELGREMQAFLAEGRSDCERLRTESLSGGATSSTFGWVVPTWNPSHSELGDYEILKRESVRRFEEYWTRILKPVFDWALPKWLEDNRDWKDSEGESLPSMYPSRWEKLMKSTLKHELARRTIVA